MSWASRNLIAIIALVGAAIGAALAFTIPPTYEAVTTAVPVPGENERLPFQAGAATEQLAGLLGGAPQRMLLYPDLIRSRTLLEGILTTRFARASQADSVVLIDLIHPGGHGALRLEGAVKRLRRLVDATIDKRTSLLSIRVRSRDPAVAAAVANLLVARLQEFTIRSTAGNATENRAFIEGRLRETRTTLARAELALEEFRDKNLRIGNSPRLQLELGSHLREVRAQEEVFLALTREYELARVAEHRDVPIINTIDPAAEPASRIWPRRGFLVILGWVLGVLLGGLVVLAKQSLFTIGTRAD